MSQIFFSRAFRVVTVVLLMVSRFTNAQGSGTVTRPPRLQETPGDEDTFGDLTAVPAPITTLRPSFQPISTPTQQPNFGPGAVTRPPTPAPTPVPTTASKFCHCLSC